MNEQTSGTLAQIQPLLATCELPSIGPEPRQSRLSIPELEKQLGFIFPKAGLSATQQSLIRSLVFLWHDHLDESHSLSQEIHTPDGSFLHGILHRREPDYWNAKYWFNRVGSHASFPEISRRAGAFLDNNSAGELKAQLLPGNRWDPMAFVDACEAALKRKDSRQIELLERLQEIELRVLLEQFCR